MTLVVTILFTVVLFLVNPWIGAVWLLFLVFIIILGIKTTWGKL